MRAALINKIGLIAVFLIASAKTAPVRFVSSDETFRNLNKNYEVIEGPKEFLVRLGQFRDILGLENLPDSYREGSDLDYMVYGKVYLMKNLGIADRSLFSSSKSDKDDQGLKNVVITRDASSTTPSPKEDQELNERIQFPEQAPSTKLRRYKFSDAPSKSNSSPFDPKNPIVRNLHERSTETAEESSVQSSVSPKPKVTNEDSTKLDDEALGLLEELAPLTGLPQSKQVLSETQIPTEIASNISNNGSKDGIVNVDDRFLIQVPDKPTLVECPQGQKRTHHGTCKPVVVHNHSPQDGIFKGKLTASASSRVVTKALNESRTDNSHLAALFRSFVQLERKLEKAVKDSEQQLSEILISQDKEKRNDTEVEKEK